MKVYDGGDTPPPILPHPWLPQTVWDHAREASLHVTPPPILSSLLAWERLFTPNHGTSPSTTDTVFGLWIEPPALK